MVPCVCVCVCSVVLFGFGGGGKFGIILRVCPSCEKFFDVGTYFFFLFSFPTGTRLEIQTRKEKERDKENPSCLGGRGRAGPDFFFFFFAVWFASHPHGFVDSVFYSHRHHVHPVVFIRLLEIQAAQ